MARRHTEISRHPTTNAESASDVRDAQSGPAESCMPDVQRAEEKFAEVFLNSLDVLLIIDSEQGTILQANQALSHILGYEPDEVVGKHFSFLYPPEPDTANPDGQDHVSVAGPVFQAQRILRRDGRVVPVDLTATPITWERNPAMLATLRDVSDRENALQALRESEERYRTLFDEATDAIVLEDEKGRILDANRAARIMTGYAHSDLITMNSSQLLAGPAAHLEKLRKDKSFLQARFETLALHREGWTIPVETSIAPLKTAGETLFLSIFRDISERKRAEEQLKAAHSELELRVQERTRKLKELNERLLQEISDRKNAEQKIIASLKEKEVLLQEIHHRVKNNLQTISSLLALQGRQIRDAKVIEALNDSQHRIRSMALIHEQLYQSKDLTGIDFSRYVRNLAQALLRSYDSTTRAVALKITSDEVLMDIGTAIPCGLIVNELVSNCLKHAFPDGRPGEIRIELKLEPPDRCALVVADNGVGLPEDIDGRTSKSLGLRLIKNLAETQLKGELRFRSINGAEASLNFPTKV